MKPPNGWSPKAFIADRIDKDLTVKSGGHLARNIVSGAMLVIGLGIVATRYIVAIVRNLGPPQWGQHELILVLVLIGGGISILFTQTALAVLHIIWPFGGKKR